MAFFKLALCKAGDVVRKGQQPPLCPSRLPVPSVLAQTLARAGMVLVKAEPPGYILPGGDSDGVYWQHSFAFLFNRSSGVEVFA